MARIRLKDGTEIDSEKVYDYSKGADDFEEIPISDDLPF